MTGQTKPYWVNSKHGAHLHLKYIDLDVRKFDSEQPDKGNWLLACARLSSDRLEIDLETKDLTAAKRAALRWVNSRLAYMMAQVKDLYTDADADADVNTNKELL